MTIYHDLVGNLTDQDLTADLWVRRQELVRLYSFAIPDDRTVQDLLPYGPFIEVGAGSGYWAYELHRAGADIQATDLFRDGPAGKLWRVVNQMDASQAARLYPNRTLLMVWPSYRQDWARKALRAYRGDQLVYCGEGPGGCCANDRFFEELDKGWKEVADLAIPQWPFINDRVAVYERRGYGKRNGSMVR